MVSHLLLQQRLSAPAALRSPGAGDAPGLLLGVVPLGESGR